MYISQPFLCFSVVYVITWVHNVPGVRLFRVEFLIYLLHLHIQVRIVPEARDSFGNLVGSLYYDADGIAKNLAMELVKNVSGFSCRNFNENVLLGCY